MTVMSVFSNKPPMSLEKFHPSLYHLTPLSLLEQLFVQLDYLIWNFKMANSLHNYSMYMLKGKKYKVSRATVQIVTSLEEACFV